jgi:hypothetical protein
MASSEVEIASNALYLIGLKPITDFDEGTQKANLMKAMYPITRDAVLRGHNWRCATKYFSTPADATPPLMDWNYAYPISNEPYVLRVLRVKDDDRGVRWRVQGRNILTNSSSPLVWEGVIRVIAVRDFDPLLEDAITFRLAAAGAMPLTESMKNLQAMLAAYKEKMEEARTVDSQEGYPEEAAMDSLIDARRSGGGTSVFRKISPA